MSTGSIILIIVGALSVAASLLLLMWRLHVRKQGSQGNDLNAAPMGYREKRDSEDYSHLNYNEKSLKDLERGLGIEREKPNQAVLGRR
jgi:hypothetical protein